MDSDNLEVCINGVDLCKQSSSDIRNKQVNDVDLKKIADCFESSYPNATEFKKWTDSGYIMLERVVYRHSDDADIDDIQQVVFLNIITYL